MEEHAEGFMSGVVTVMLAVISVSALAVVLSRNSTMPTVVENVASGLANDLTAAEAPVTGATEAANLSYDHSSYSDWATSGSAY